VRRLLNFDHVLNLDSNIELSCVDLLQAMELEGSEMDEMDCAEKGTMEDLEGEEMMNLSNEWIFDLGSTGLDQVQSFNGEETMINVLAATVEGNQAVGERSK
jgi:hypothetical protein